MNLLLLTEICHYAISKETITLCNICPYIQRFMEMTDNDKEVLWEFFNASMPVSEDLFSELIKHFTKRKYNKGDIILKIGEIETLSKIVIKGVVHQFVYDEEEAVTINITPKGLSFNSLASHMDATPSIEVHEAIADVEILCIEKSAINQILQDEHRNEFALLLFKIYETILRDRENRMYVLQHRNPSKRFQLFFEMVERAKYIINHTPDKYIASYLNMTPQQYSREKRNYLEKLK